MAPNPRAEHIYEFASVWLNECLLNDGSLFWPEQQTWTRDHLNNFWSAFAENLDEGAGSFVEKWQQQLSGQSIDVHRMAVEVTAIYCLFPRDQQMGPASKRKLIGEVMAFRNDLGEMDHPRWSLFEKAIEGGGIGLTGAGYLAGRPFHMGMYLSFAKTVKEYGATSIDELRPKTVIDEAFNFVAETMSYRPISTKHILLHILWPERFEDYASADYKKKMAKNLSAHFGLPEREDIDETILQARKHMEANGYEPNFSMYANHVEPIWDPKSSSEPERNLAETPPNYDHSTSHILVDRAQVYELGHLFRTRVIDQGNSFLWPNESLWTDDNIEEFLIRFRDMPVEKGQTWLQIYEAEFATSGPQSARILADSYALIMQFVSVGVYRGSTKAENLNSILEWIPSPSDQQTLQRVLNAFAIGIGSPGMAFTAALSHQIAYVPLFVRCLQQNNDGDIQSAADEASKLAMTKYNFQRSTVPARNIVLHLFEPERFERVASRSHKVQIVDSFSLQLEDLTFASDDIDAQIREIRSRLAGRHFAKDFDFYDHDVSPYWDGDKILNGTDADNLDNGAILPDRPTTTDLSENTFLDESFLLDIETLLESKQQLIFEGPPGSGKTFVAEQFARYFTGQSLHDEQPNDQIELVQFHQSYSYEDFVEGIRPRTNEDGYLVYDVEPGIFRTFADRARRNPDKNFVLIIDEINRGNVSRILGELMLLLEYRDKSATLPYSKEQLQIPANLYIIGTMNTADRSLSQIDYALRRRFYFVRFMSVENGEARVLEGWLRQQALDAATHSRVLQSFIALNEQLETDLGTDDLQVGHSYFMDMRIHDDRHQQHIWTYAVLPLIREYLYHHRERDSLLQNYQLDRIIRIAEPAIEDQADSKSGEAEE